MENYPACKKSNQSTESSSLCLNMTYISSPFSLVCMLLLFFVNAVVVFEGGVVCIFAVFVLLFLLFCFVFNINT